MNAGERRDKRFITAASHAERSIEAPGPASNPRDRPRRADARCNRSRVLTAAQEAFAQDGIAVPLDEIARRARVGKATVYRHFQTKDALFEAAMFERVEAICNREVELLASGDPEAFFTCLAELFEAGAADRALSDALSGAPCGTLAACPQISDRLMTRMADLLRAAQHASVVRPDIRAVDLKPLIVGLLAAQAVTSSETSSRWLLEITRDGLRASRAT